MLGQRIITAAVLLACCVAGLWFVPHWAWTLAVAAFFSAGALEWARLTGLGPAATILFIAAVAASICAPLAGLSLSVVAIGWVLSGLAWAILMPAFLARAAPVRKASLPLGAQPWHLLSLMAVVWIADTGAYFAGRGFGRHKLAPSISPGKTWEGVAGGAACVALYLAILQGTGGAGEGPLAGAAGWSLAVTLTALSVLGDLFESLVKRQAGAKDSGTLLPGHGGVLDRIDGLTSTLPVAALALYISAG
jgi:phosphatidate cytidylyltransferase